MNPKNETSARFGRMELDMERKLPQGWCGHGLWQEIDVVYGKVSPFELWLKKWGVTWLPNSTKRYPQ